MDANEVSAFGVLFESALYGAVAGSARGKRALYIHGRSSRRGKVRAGDKVDDELRKGVLADGEMAGSQASFDANNDPIIVVRVLVPVRSFASIGTPPPMPGNDRVVNLRKPCTRVLEFNTHSSLSAFAN